MKKGSPEWKKELYKISGIEHERVKKIKEVSEEEKRRMFHRIIKLNKSCIE